MTLEDFMNDRPPHRWETLMLRKFTYAVHGTAGDGQTWSTTGHVEVTNEAINTVVDLILRDSFLQLTKGKAVFGKPGVGCKGPYDIDKIEIVQIKK